MGFAISEMQLFCAAFEDGEAIPARHTAYADNISPAFSWSNLPKNTQSLALICHDPDAPLVTADGKYGYVHWVLYNIPADIDGLSEGTPNFTAGINNADTEAYFGPRPPQGHGLHRYFFWLLALDKNTELPPGLGMWEFLEKAEPNLIGMNRLCGTFRKD
ncbi:MAG: YbhB/YbcL family Raf kinase inhibitor-like protein [Porticoccaceae bacterium]